GSELSSSTWGGPISFALRFSASVPSAAAAPVSAAAATSVAARLGAGARFGDRQRPPVDFPSVQGGHCGFCLVVVGELDKAEAFRATRPAVGNDRDRVRGAVSAEEVAQVVLR